MEGTPAGWYDDPEQPGQQRYWDGTTWTENRAPTSPPAPATPGAFPLPPPGAPPAKSSNKVLWIILAVVGVIGVLVFLAVLAVTFLGGDGVTTTLEKELPAELESDLASQDLNVTITKVDCDDVSDSDGPFTTTCAVTVDGLPTALNVVVKGTVDGNNVRGVTATSDPILDESLATKQAQALVDVVDDTVTVTSCSLSAPVVLVSDNLAFTCQTDTAETVTFGVQSGRLVISQVS